MKWPLRLRIVRHPRGRTRSAEDLGLIGSGWPSQWGKMKTRNYSCLWLAFPVLAVVALPTWANADDLSQDAASRPAAESLPVAGKAAEDDGIRRAELDSYWAEVSRAVKEGDFEAYRATCHPEGVLVSGAKQMSQPLAVALARWKPEFVDTRDGKRQSKVEFRFSKRVGDATTAHESGIFRYTFNTVGETPKSEYVHFEALLVKRQDGWKIVMENQKGPATENEWESMK